ncbi:gamma-glutamylcyclotransferase [Jatrophihabitans fulvus]
MQDVDDTLVPLPDDTDAWLAARGAVPMARRRPVLAYGSNACPSKIAWLRTARALPGPVVVHRVRCRGLAAVWAAGLRVVDDQRPATLAALPGAEEVHAVWWAAEDQVAALDACEGRGVRYDLATVRSGSVEIVDDGRRVEPLAYVGRATARLPLLVDGAPVRCRDVPQADAVALVGRPAGTDGLDLLRW